MRKRSKRLKLPTRLLRTDRQSRKKGYGLIAGVDEAGRGPLAGPVVAACVVLRKTSFTCRIDDSKLLTEKERLAAYSQIMDMSDFGIGVIGEDTIDLVNIRNAARMAMERAVKELGYTPDILLIDGRDPVNLPIKKKCIIKGDRKSLSIACASILAKVTRDRIMSMYDVYYPAYGFARHKGYGTKQHLVSLSKHGPCPIHRFTYSPVRDAKVQLPT